MQVTHNFDMLSGASVGDISQSLISISKHYNHTGQTDRDHYRPDQYHERQRSL